MKLKMFALLTAGLVFGNAFGQDKIAHHECMCTVNAKNDSTPHNGTATHNGTASQNGHAGNGHVAKPPDPPDIKKEIAASLKVGILAQFHAQALQEQTTAVQDAKPDFDRRWQRQLFVRRLRILVGANLSEKTSIFFESDAPNIGKVEPSGAKAATVTMYVQDAQIQHIFSPALGIIAGLQLAGISRNGLQGAGALMALNYGSYQFVTNSALDNNVGRDLGLNGRGFLANERLEYRLGVFSGKNVNLYSPLRLTARLNYNFKDREKGFYYTGTTLGKGKILALGGGLDMQGDYRGFAIDMMADTPLGSAGSLTASAAFSLLDGGGSNTDSSYFMTLIPRQRIFFGELGYFFKKLHAQPYVKFESQSVDASVLRQVGAITATLDLQNKLRSKSRLGLGLNYFLSGHNASIKLLYEFVFSSRRAIDPATSEKLTSGEFTLQLQYLAF